VASSSSEVDAALVFGGPRLVRAVGAARDGRRRRAGGHGGGRRDDDDDDDAGRRRCCSGPCWGCGALGSSHREDDRSVTRVGAVDPADDGARRTVLLRKPLPSRVVGRRAGGLCVSSPRAATTPRLGVTADDLVATCRD